MALEPTLRSLWGPILHPGKVTGNPQSMPLGPTLCTRAGTVPSLPDPRLPGPRAWPTLSVACLDLRVWGPCAVVFNSEAGCCLELVLRCSLGGSAHVWGTSGLCLVRGLSPNSLCLLCCRLGWWQELPELRARAGSGLTPRLGATSAAAPPPSVHRERDPCERWCA